jgi:hypothetical protein
MKEEKEREGNRRSSCLIQTERSVSKRWSCWRQSERSGSKGGHADDSLRGQEEVMLNAT